MTRTKPSPPQAKAADAVASPSKSSALHEDFLSGPPPNITKETIDFSHTNLAEYNGLWAVILDGVLSLDECKTLVKAAESQGEWERAMVNIGGGMQAMYTDTRNCGRIIWDSQEIVAKIWARCAQHVPEIKRLENWPKVTGVGPVKRKEPWRLTRLNERMRFLKYTGGEYFRPHCDGCYETPDRSERSYFTLHLYLNDADSEEADGNERLVGGATTFHSYNMEKDFDVKPKVGRVLLFQHSYLMHSGDDVIQGKKLTLRTDIMFEKEPK
ncbi:oxidoreductase domain-containing protein [Aulographum hederae CBS 113979]|uniref:Oxidoreductase domain-containing protein n=1 Tax=Aulographum hederae CBS 113979 TaxID=1176131 RepID=A0A6G1GXC8_9PEZI|nr:oxidoreductase domain-containing protein [Aulographum hederae CBS 113979]